jgi:hypothetical protein
MAGSTRSEDGYHHDPMEDSMQQIRLLRFGLHLPEMQSQDALSITIETHNISRAPLYHAISYLWGDNRTIHNVTMNGKTLAIRPNCYSALLQLQLRQTDSYFWIDAICINQNDNVERSNQVALMSKIYKNASLVLVSLPFCDVEGDCLQNLTASMERSLNCLSIVSMQEYWTRMWIVQEITLAGHVILMMGFLEEIDLQDIFDRWSVIGAHLEFAGHEADQKLLDLYHAIYEGPFEKLFASRNWWRLHVGSHKRSSLEGQLYLLLVNHGKRCCQDRRDKIFALLGLILLDDDKDGSSILKPDYTRTPFEVACQLLTEPYAGRTLLGNHGAFCDYAQRISNACLDEGDPQCKSAVGERVRLYAAMKTIDESADLDIDNNLNSHTMKPYRLEKSAKGSKLPYDCFCNGPSRRKTFILPTDHEEMFYRVDVCDIAQFGDFLCHVDGSLHVVLRHSANGICRIIGLALLETVPASWLSEFEGSNWIKQDYHRQDFEVYLHGEDLLVWAHCFVKLASAAGHHFKYGRFEQARGPGGSLEAYLSRSFTHSLFSSYARFEVSTDQ